MMMRYARAPGVRVEPVGDSWAAFSPLSGETLLLNDEAAAILEVLEANGAIAADEVRRLLAADTGEASDVVAERLRDSWTHLETVGLALTGQRVAAAR
jgi:PqqD family protein of HPr-rel-A system